MAIIIHYSEIGIKGRNKYVFEELLIKTIETRTGRVAKILPGRILIEGNLTSALYKVLGKVFGIAWFAGVEIVDQKLENIEAAVVKDAKKRLKAGVTFKVNTRRSEKVFGKTSREINELLGERIINETGAVVDLEHPDVTVGVEIASGRAFILNEKHRGLSGLPVGCGGKVLVLLSGGVDSAVATFMMLSRGCSIEYVHFHGLASPDEIAKSKMPALMRLLQEYGGSPAIHLIDATPVQLAFHAIKPKQELVMFRRFMILASERLGHELGVNALVMGDSLGQVASQTVQNIAAAQSGVGLPVFRPLIGLDKEWITKKAQDIGVFAIANQEYKDCCSIAAKSPDTKARTRIIKHVAKKMNLEEFVIKGVGQKVKWTVD